MADPRPAAPGIPSGHFPGPPVESGHVVPCPRRIRAHDGDRWVVDTTRAFYVWEHPYYPQYAVPAADLPDEVAAEARDIRADERLADHVVLRFDAADAWYEEDERVHGHPRNPYVRVDALRAHRRVRVVLRRPDGPDEVLADSADAVAVFETGLPPRWYVDPTCVDWSLLTPTDTVTRCPYKGLATDWWRAGDLGDVAWSYPAPTPALQAIAGLVSFDDTTVEVTVGSGNDAVG